MPGVAKSEENYVIENEMDEYFYTFVSKPNPKKKRRCLKCGIPFLSANYGNRTCGSCASQNQKASFRAGNIY
jgi:ribosomal protein S27AE